MSKFEPGVIIRGGGRDPRTGEELPPAGEIPVPRCVILPRYGKETDNDGLLLIHGWRVLIKRPTAAQKGATGADRFAARGEVHQIKGSVMLFPGGRLLEFFTERAGI